MDFDRRAQDLVDDLDQVVAKLQGGSVSDSANLLQEAEDLIYDVERELNDLQPQTRHLGFQERREANQRLEELREQLRRNEGIVERFKSNRQPGGGGVNLAAMSRRDRQAYKSERERLLAAKGMIDEDDASLSRSIHHIAETTDIATQTTVELQEQRESMLRSQRALDENNDFLTRSRSTLRRMRRRLMTNRLLSFVIILIELFVIALIIWLKFFN